MGVAFAMIGLMVLSGSAAPHPQKADPDPDVDGSMPEDYFPGLKVMLQEALQQAPSLVVNEMNIEIAQAQKLYNGISPMLPHVGGNLLGGENSQKVVSNSSGSSSHGTSFQYDLGASQALFQWGQLKNGLLQQKVAVAINERNYATVYMQFAQTLRRTYVGLIAAKIALRNAQFNLDLRKKAYASAQEQLKGGFITAAAAAGPQLENEDAQIAEEISAQSYLYQRQQLGRMVGRREIPDAEIPVGMPAPKFSTSAAADLTADLLRTGARYTPDAQLGLLNIRNWALQYQINKVNLLPRISATADVNQQNNASVSTGAQLSQYLVETQSYYIRADWNIFDGLATRGRKEEALIHRRQAERDLKMKVDSTLDAAQNSQKMVELAWRQLDLATRRDWINQDALRRAIDDLANHVVSSESVSSARANAYVSEYGLAISRSNFLSQWADFVSLVGHDPALNNIPARYVRPIQ
jgi:outer membrane protein TolC